jgi:flavin reductase (DIM6/NTAB) family NADH-FMN oxidoreductase RutF
MVSTLTSPYISNSVLEGVVGLLMVKAGEARNAMTVSFFSEVAHHPTALWVAVSAASLTHSLLEQSGRFSLAVLNQNQKEIALACGYASGREVDKCAGLDLYESQGGFLFLNRALASTGCVLRERVATGDHTLFIGDIMEAEMDSRSSHLRQLLLADL